MINESIHEPHRTAARVVAALLSYPDAQLRAALPELGIALLRDTVLSAEHRDAVFALIVDMQRGDPLEAEARYVDTFDRGRRTSLHLFEHVHGDSRDRGPAMIDLQQTYAQEGLLLAPGELPDYLPVVLEFASTQIYEVAREFLAEMAHLLQSIHAALARQESPYAAAVAAALDLADEPVQRPETVPEAPAEASLDEQWAEPAVFDGCSVAGQNAASRVQPIQIVRRDAASPRRSKEAFV
ncbi:nitrate reductase molybdenum cofactor assembly chaperone [Paraburkholderia fungorum]|jgi:nitrate reductase delta subunit|uniref:nitrate reductase molybdenum cofactor assembly chaperone n=1 Tax=Paraburkholderia fungorum TaxID=134537 RepID=UPI0038B899A2